MNYFEEGKVVSQSGQVYIYKYNNDLHLEIGPGHNLWATGSEIREYKQQISHIPKGDCLEIGLGLGVVSNYILNIEGVSSLTTIEKNKDVIECYKQLLNAGEYIGDIRHNVINDDVHNILPDICKMDLKYDFIFFDHYSLIDEDTIEDLELLIPIARKTLRDNGVIMGWFDPYTPTEFVNKFYELF